MKRLFIICLLFSSTVGLSAQIENSNYLGTIRLSVSQDLKLMTHGDKERGYYPIVRDLLFQAKLEGYDFKGTNIKLAMGIEYENAALNPSFSRWGVGIGLSFYTHIRKGFLGNEHDMNWTITPSVKYGWIVRDNFSTDNFTLSIDHSTPIAKGINFIMTHQVLQRTDLGLLYNDKGVWRYSFFVGLEYQFKNI